MATDGKRAVIYARISKSDEKYAKVVDQEADCRKLAAREGYTVVRVYSDDGISAYSGKERPGWNAMLADLPGREFDVIVAVAQDRLSRDPQDSLKLLAMSAEADVVWHMVRGGIVNPQDTVGEVLAFFQGWAGKHESKNKSDRVKDRWRQNREAGRRGPGQRPFGWNREQTELVPTEADLVRRGTEMVLSGASTYEVAKVFRDSGVKTVRGKDWVSANVTAVLRRWRNAGWVEHEDEAYGEAVWPAIVTKDDVQNVRKILDRGRIAGRWRTPTMLCSGIARCHCGLTLMVTGDDGGAKAYRCSGIINNTAEPGKVHVTIRAALLDPIVRDAVVDAYFSRPASSMAGKVEAESLARIYAKQDALGHDRAKVQQLARAGVYKPHEAAAEIAKIEADVNDLEAEARNLAASSAHAAMLAESMNAMIAGLDVKVAAHDPETGEFHAGLAMVQSAMRDGASEDDALNSLADAKWWDLDESGRPVRAIDPAVREAVTRRFDSMDLERRRDLTRSLVTITVKPGRGVTKRVSIEPVERAAAVPA